MKTYQNQLADAQQTIAELAHENRMLRTLHKRQDTALAKYESTNAELPKLLHSHAEELRVWQAKYRNLQVANKELEQKLKQKETLILSLSDQNKYYSQLNKDKNLDERQRLTEKLQHLEARLQEKDNDMKLLARKIQLETKNFKQQLLNEQKKTKDIMIKLEKSRLEVSGYRKLDELNLPEKFNNLSLRRKTNDENPKLEKELEKVLEKPELDFSGGEDLDFPTSNRSSRCSISKLDSSRSTPSKSTSRKSFQLNQEQQIPLTQRRLDRGDGDAPNLNDLKKSADNKQKRHSQMDRNDSNMSVKYEDDFENADNEEENADSLNEGTDNEEEEVADMDDITVHNGNGDEDDLDDDDDVVIKTKPSSRMKNEISSIRKQISNDYKEREAFLDTFCRQATNTSIRDESAKKRNSINLGRKIPSSRKHKLLAALKAIEDNKSQD